MRNKNKHKGFTLIELLVVIAIIGLLASIVLVALNSARQKSRITKRIADLKQISTALELYYNTNNAYPLSNGGNWNTACSNPGWYSTTTIGTIPGLVPNYVSSIPTDPAMNAAANQNCYLYNSNGTDYKFLDYSLTDMTPAQITQNSNFIDPARNSLGVINGCVASSPEATNALAIYSSGARCW